MKRRIHSLGLWLLALGLACWTTGCATSGAGKLSKIEIRVSPEGTVFVADERVAMSTLARTLKSRGAGANTAVYVEIPHHTSPDYMETLTETLVKGGLPRIMFTKPRRAVAEVDTP